METDFFILSFVLPHLVWSIRLDKYTRKETTGDDTSSLLLAVLPGNGALHGCGMVTCLCSVRDGAIMVWGWRPGGEKGDASKAWIKETGRMKGVGERGGWGWRGGWGGLWFLGFWL